MQTKWFNHLLKSFSSNAHNFWMMQFRNTKYKPRGRRYSLDEKLTALALFKQSPRAYRLLRTMFSLPSKSSLLQVLARCQLNTGINENLMESLKDALSSMEKRDLFCSLVFDEMELSQGLQYSTRNDTIIGFEEYEGVKLPNFASHACVFMVRGIGRNWKQPIAFVFSGSSIPTLQLKATITLLIERIQSTGLKIKATICDQGTTNVAAIKSLIEDTKAMYLRKQTEFRKMGFEVNGEEVVPIFDPPHLMKGIRNNLLKKNLQFEQDGVKKLAKWQDIVSFYKMDQRSQDHRLCPKLTDQHVVVGKIRLMKVRNCTQVFSQRVSANLRDQAQWALRLKTVQPGAELPLDPNATETADLLLFMDRLFDSVNGNNLRDVKPLKRALQDGSNHIRFWREAKAVLRTMKYIGGPSKVATIKNWILTLDGLEYLWNDLHGNHDFQYLHLRHFNQGCIENFFGCIRSHGFRNIKPTCWQFVHSFKSLIVCNFNTTHSPGYNCEEDGSIVLDKMKKLFSFSETDLTESAITIDIPKEVDVQETSSRTGDSAQTYVAGYVARKMLATMNGCEKCKDALTVLPAEGIHHSILVREYEERHSLTYPK